MNRCTVVVLALTMLAAAAFSPSTPQSQATGLQFSPPVAQVSPTPAASPTFTPFTPDESGMLGIGADTVDPSQADQAVRQAVDWLREASGIRAELGPHADELFRQVEEAQTALTKDMMAKWPVGAKPKGMPAPLPPRRWAPLPGPEVAALTLVSLFLSISPLTGLDSRFSQMWNSDPQGDGYSFALGDNATAHIKQQVTGSKLEMEFEIAIRAEKDGAVYEEKAKGKIGMTICPDEKGNVPLDMTVESGGGSSDKGFQINTTTHAVGHVDDEANLAGFDQDGQTDVTVKTGGRNLFGGVNTEQAAVRLGYTLSGFNTPDLQGLTVTNGRESVSFSYLFAGQQVKDLIKAVAVNLSTFEAATAFKSAEKKWQDGFCVAIVVPEGENQEVEKGSETTFTAKVQHKFEGTGLTVPVVATLDSGAVSVTPSNTKVPAPASFRYKAPEEPRGEAKVELVSRSRRGIGKSVVTFRTEEQSYRVDTAWAGSTIRLTGAICAFDKPFTLKLGGHKPNGTPYAGKVEFTPSDATSGSWMATGSYTIPYSSPTNDSGGSTYQVTGLADGKPMIVLNAFTQHGSSAVFSASFDWPGMEIPLIPESGTCSKE